MTAHKPKRRNEWNAPGEIDFDDDSSAYNEVDHAAMEALAVHLGSERYLDGHAE